jgi:hypothetical protein
MKTVFSVGSAQRSYLEDNRRYEFSQFSLGDSHGKFVVEEEYKRSACEDLTCVLKSVCVL